MYNNVTAALTKHRASATHSRFSAYYILKIVALLRNGMRFQ